MRFFCYLAASLLSLALTAPALAGEFAIVRNANQAEQPFLLRGQVLTEESKFWRKYRSSIARFPDLGSCFNPPVGETIDSENFDWNRIRNTRDLDLCAFRVASSLSGPEEMAAFLEELGFQNVKVFIDPIAYLIWPDKLTNARRLEAGWSTVGNGLPYRERFVPKWWAGWLYKGLTIQIIYSEQAYLLTVQSGITVE